MADTMLEWIRHAYFVAPAIDTDEKVDELVSVIVEATGEDEGMVRQEVLSIIKDVRRADRIVAVGG